MRLSREDIADLIRSLGGLMLAAGAVVLYVRKSGHHEWSGFARLLVVLIPAAGLYLMALGVFEAPRSRGRPWQSVLMVTSILLWPVALFSLLAWLGASSSRHPAYAAGVFAVTALLAAYAARQARVRYAALLSGLSLLFVWLYIWQVILGTQDAGTARWLTVAAGALLLGAAVALARAKAIGAGEVATAGGIAAVSAGVIGVLIGLTAGVAGLFSSSSSSGSGAGPIVATRGSPAIGGHGPLHRIHPAVVVHHAAVVVHRAAVVHHAAARHAATVHRHAAIVHHAAVVHHVATHHGLMGLTHPSGAQDLGWDVYLLVVSLALIWIAARWSVRGLGYVGGVGLLAFIGSVAVQVTRVETGHRPTGSLLGWPLILLILGAVGLLAPLLYRRGAT